MTSTNEHTGPTLMPSDTTRVLGLVAPQPGGPSAKNARRAGSPNHQRNTSEENPMVEPNPAARQARLARLEQQQQHRMDAGVEGARDEFSQALAAWGSWADYVRQRRELALGNHLGEPNDPVLDDPEYVAVLLHADPIRTAQDALSSYRSDR